MSYLSADITTAADGPFQLSALFKIAGGTIAGVTVTPSAAASGSTPPLPAPAARIPQQTVVQADPGNGSNLIYVGTDGSLLPTAGGGTGIVLAAGVSYTFVDTPLTGIWVSASANGTKLNAIASGGFQ